LPRHVSPNKYGNTTIAGQATVHMGNINRVHHYHYSSSPSNANAVGCGDDLKTLVDSLAFERWEDRISNVGKPSPHTCGWLFEHQNFKAWIDPTRLDEHHGFLWIKGHPGCGKSTIMKHAIEWVGKRWAKDWTAIAYFFNARATEDLEKSSLGLYRSLALQLLDAFPTLHQLFLKAFATKLRGNTTLEWNAPALRNFIAEAIQTIESSLCIFIDALDEGQESDIRRMISFLEDLTTRARESGTTFRICLSSRHYPHITIKRGLSVEVERQSEHNADIARYIEIKLNVDEPEQMNSLREEINAKSAGIFLWVVLVIEVLNQVYDRGEGFNAMIDCLRRVPENLEGLFIDILVKSSMNISTCISLLRWVLFCTRPLSPVELYSAVQHTEVPASIGNGCQQAKLQDASILPKYILHHSRGLVEVTAANPPVVQFIHETVREFLLATNRLIQLDELSTSLAPAPSHEALKSARLRCISCKPELLEAQRTIKEVCPLLKYSAASLLRHAEAAEANGMSQIAFCQRMLAADDVQWRNYVHCRNLYEKQEIRKWEMDVHLLYAATEQDLSHLVNTLAKSLVDVNKEGGRYGNALQAACRSGNEEIVRCLISNGVNINASGGEHKHAVIAAILGKNFAIAKLLIDKGTKVDNTLLNKALATMVDRKSAQGVKMLLGLRTTIPSPSATFLRDYIFSDARFCAAVITVFVEAGFVNSDDVSLHLNKAVRDHNQSIVRMLLDVCIEVHQENREYVAPHVAAAFAGRERPLESFVDAVANVNQWRSGVCCTAWRAATDFQNFDLMDLLLRQGADVNAQARRRVTALHAACEAGDVDTVRLLLQYNADTNVLDGAGRTPLLALSFRRECSAMPIAQILLQHGADVNAQAARCGTALHAACEAGNTDAVELLLLYNADTDVLDEAGKTPLLALPFWRNHCDISVAQILLQHGADVNAQDIRCATALHAACEASNVTAVELLLQYNADINILDEAGRTPLSSVAFGYGHSAMSVALILLRQ